MKKILLILSATVFLLSACTNEKKSEEKTSAEASPDSAGVDSSPKDKAWIPIDSAMMEKAWKESMTLGEQHKMLA